MALSVPFTFGPLTGPIPLSDLDADFSAVTTWINARNPTVGPIASRPAAGNAGALWIASDQGFIVYADDGAAWNRVDLPGPNFSQYIKISPPATPGANTIDLFGVDLGGVAFMGTKDSTGTVTVLGQQSRPGASTGLSSGIATVLASGSGQTGANTTETDALNFTVPGNAMVNAFDGLEVVFRFRTAANANNKRFRVYYGATVALDTAAVAWNLQAGWASTTIHRTGAATQKAFAFWLRGTNGAEVSGLFATQVSTPAETLSGAVLVRVTMQNGTASAADCVVDLAQVRYWPGS